MAINLVCLKEISCPFILELVKNFMSFWSNFLHSYWLHWCECNVHNRSNSDFSGSWWEHGLYIWRQNWFNLSVSVQQKKTLYNLSAYNQWVQIWVCFSCYFYDCLTQAQRSCSCSRCVCIFFPCLFTYKHFTCFLREFPCKVQLFLRGWSRNL